MPSLLDFIAESNRIEGITRSVRDAEINAHEDLLALNEIMVEDLEIFVNKIEPGIKLRDRHGDDVYIGAHFPPPGGPAIRLLLAHILSTIEDAWETHTHYETLHPFMDGNGRSGRALWAWQMRESGRDPFALPFLHCFYYQTLEHTQRNA